MGGTDEKAPADRASGRGTWHRKASRPVTWWILALFGVVFLHRWIPDSTWVVVHTVTLGLITNSVLVWSQHFAEALLRNRLPDAARPAQLRRIRLLNLGILVLFAGMVAVVPAAVWIGAVAVGTAVGWHAASLARQLRTALPARFSATVRWYVVAAWFLPAGALIGAMLGTLPLDADLLARLQLAHEAVNVLGFVGTTVMGTLLTLWPTILRTRMADAALPRTRLALRVLVAGVLATTAGALAGTRLVAAAGLVVCAGGVGLLLALLVSTARGRRPREYASLSVLAGVCWLVVGVLWCAGIVARTPFPGQDLSTATPALVAGFLVQVLLGAMTYLLPATMGGGPAAVRAGNRVLTRWSWLRITVAQLCLVVFVLPADWTGSWVRAAVSVLGALALFAFVPLMVLAVRAQVAERRRAVAARERGEKPTALERPAREAGRAPAHPRREILAGAGLTALGVAAGVAADPTVLRSSLRRLTGAGQDEGTGQTTRVRVTATSAMRFEPSRIEVPAGNRLVVDLRNEDRGQVHDLVLDNGATSGRVDPGGTATVDAGVVQAGMEGWCSIVGHRTMGMTLSVAVVGAESGPSSARAAEAGEEPVPDLARAPAADHVTRSATLDPLPGQVSGRTHRLTLEVRETRVEVVPGIALEAWTYDGAFDGPVLHGRVGDVFEVRLVNHGSMGHSVDFHAGDLAPDRPMRTIAPGESLEYRFEAKGAGAWLYHCSTTPMSTHLASGMTGAVVIEPAGLAAADRQFLLVQNDTYLRTTGRTDGAGRQIATVDPERIRAGVPTLTMFNGHATQYVAHPLEARAGERVRMWVLAAGPAKGCSFHVVGGQFLTTWKEGAYLLRDGRDAFGGTDGRSQALDLAPAQGGFVELVFPEAGTYTFVNHDFAEMERGARGLVRVR